jgi:tetratricopeptide (TPR) repeat protein
MNHRKLRERAVVPALIFAAVMIFIQTASAESFPFRVAFENVPGVEEIEAGDFPAGIKVLEDQLNEIDQEYSGDTWATLCAAYIMNASLHKAAFACDKAVEIDPSETAYNNRGVYRAFTGNLSGAREDFQRARPHQLESYLEELRAKDVGLMATDNFDLINELSAEYAPLEITHSTAIRTAKVENLAD